MVFTLVGLVTSFSFVVESKKRLSRLAYLLCVVRAPVDQLVAGDLVVRAALRWGHPGQQDAGLGLGLPLEV